MIDICPGRVGFKGLRDVLNPQDSCQREVTGAETGDWAING